jgi:hypothetical protein
MLQRLLMFLPRRPPEWLIGFWAAYGALLIVSLFVQGFPSGAANRAFYIARLVVGILCWLIAAALVWRRSQHNP